MKKVININFQGQVIAIEETAFEILSQYIDNLKAYFHVKNVVTKLWMILKIVLPNFSVIV